MKSSKKPPKKPHFSEKPAKKKAFGQHFLRKRSVVDNMIERVQITDATYVLEIGCGDGFLTEQILEQTDCKALHVYEIDREWAEFVREKISDTRLHINIENILDVDWQTFDQFQPLILLANLPYQITFPILFRLQAAKDLFQEGVVMVQEEVAQKLVASRGRSYSATSLFLQHHFTLSLLEKIEPGAFSPPPKVHSRLVYFKPRKAAAIPEEKRFWKFLKLVFNTPRQTLKNNLRKTHFTWQKLPAEKLSMRAQQLSFDDFLQIWEILRIKSD